MSQEVHLPAVFAFEIKDVACEPAQCDEDHVFKKVSGIDQNSRTDRCHQGVVDAVDFFRVRVCPCQGSVEDADSEKNIGILEPLQVIGDRRFRGLMVQGLEVAGQVVHGVE